MSPSEIMANNAQACYTLSGHLVGMLDRDQRTVRQVDLLDACPRCSCTISENSRAAITSQSKSPSIKSGTCPRWSMQRVKKVLAVVTYLLIVIPTVMSAPTGSDRSEPFWVLNEDVQPEENITQALREQLAKTIQMQAKIACNKANHSLEAYTRHHFSMTPQQVHERYNSTSYDWLPSREDIPKQFGQDVTDGFTRTMEDEMIHLYHQFQKIAVGLEQIIKEYNGCEPRGGDQTFCRNFIMMKEDLTTLLRELNMNFGTMGLEGQPDVSRDTMPEKDRDVDETARRIRNWVIYRDYLNALEYTIKSFGSYLGEEALLGEHVTPLVLDPRASD